MTNSDSKQTDKKTLLHACCGPCSLEPTRILREDGFELTIFYANSNIDPGDEYQHRLQTLQDWAQTQDLPVVEGTYDHDAWRAAVADAAKKYPGVREQRCRACYRIRFEEAAAYAQAHGYDVLSSTLSVSPYQYTEIIEEELNRAADAVGIKAEFRDFRPNYDDATRRSRDLGMYRQNYCGCEFSYKEAQDEREERKAQRAAQRQAYLAQHAEELAAAAAEKEQRKAEKQAYEQKQARKREVLKALRYKG